MLKNLSNLYKTKRRLIHYFFMAAVIVGIELLIFQAIYIYTANYYIATVVSFITGVVLNWIGGRVFIFGTSRHNPLKEFLMILTASLVGILIQLIVVFLSVQLAGLYPLIGKVLSITFSFFWNYWFRSAIVYKSQSSKAE